MLTTMLYIGIIVVLATVTVNAIETHREYQDKWLVVSTISLVGACFIVSLGVLLLS